MATTQLPPSKEKAHEIARKIANERPLKKDKDAPTTTSPGVSTRRAGLTPTPGATKITTASPTATGNSRIR